MNRIILNGFIVFISLFPLLLPSQICSASTPTPTPAVSGEYLEISDLEGMNIYHPRADTTYGAIFLFSDLAGNVPSWGLIYDDENTFYDMYSGGGEVRLRSIILSGYSTQAGDNILLTYDGNQKKRVYLPEMTGYNELYIGLDGSTYYDQWFSQTAQEAVPPTPTPTTTSSPSPTPEGYRTPSPSPTPSPTPEGYRTPTPQPSPTTTPMCYCCPIFWGYQVTLTNQDPVKNAGEYDTCLCCGAERVTWWTTSSGADWVEFLPEQGLNWNNYQIFVALGDTSSLAPGQHQGVISIHDNYCLGTYYLDINYNKLTPIITQDGDYNGDGSSDIAIFRPASGLWAIRGITRTYFGGNSDIPVAGDYSGSGTATIGIFRSSSGLWVIRGMTRFYFGSSSDYPVPGDYNGDTVTDIAIYRPSNGLWAARGKGRIYYGAGTDIPISGDYNGDGASDIAVFRPESGLWAIRGFSRFYFGIASDFVVPGDYNGDGAWEPGIFRNTSGLWAIRGVTRGYYGSLVDEPVPADYQGNGRDDIGIFRDSSGLWAIRGVSRVYFGGPGDLPVTR